MSRAPSPRSTPAPPRMTAQERRQSLIEAILEVFLEYGVDNVRTKTISERAGAAESILYRHFTSKDAMLETAVYETVLARLEDLVSRVKNAVDEAGEGMGAAAFHRTFLDGMIEVAPLIAVAVFQEGSKASEFYQHHLFPALQRVFAAAGSALELRGKSPDLRRATLAAVFGMHIGIALDAWLQGITLDVPATARHLQALLTVDS